VDAPPVMKSYPGHAVWWLCLLEFELPLGTWLLKAIPSVRTKRLHGLLTKCDVLYFAVLWVLHAAVMKMSGFNHQNQ
jgi:hypothetical protein